VKKRNSSEKQLTISVTDGVSLADCDQTVIKSPRINKRKCTNTNRQRY